MVEAFCSLSRLVLLVLFFLIIDCGYPLFLVLDSRGGGAHPPGVAPEASVECLDSSEVFCTFYRGMLLYRGVFCPFSFEVWPSVVEPPSLMCMRLIRVLTIFYCSTLTLLL
jgi:hypothetical protein